jgi:hypothetical protein
MMAHAAHSPSTRRYLRDVSEALFYRGTPLPQQRLDWVEHEAMATLFNAGTRARLLFCSALFLVAWLAPLWVRRLPTITRLPLPLRITALTKLEESRLGAPLVMGLKTVLCFIYYEQAEPLRELGQVSTCARSPAPGHSLPLLPPDSPHSSAGAGGMP